MNMTDYINFGFSDTGETSVHLSSWKVTFGASVNLLLPHFILSELTEENVKRKVMMPPRIPPISMGNLYSWVLEYFLAILV